MPTNPAVSRPAVDPGQPFADQVAALKVDISEAQKLASDPSLTQQVRSHCTAYADGITHALHTLGLIR